MNDDLFGRIAGAVLDGRVVALEYHGRRRAQPTVRRVHPYRLMHYRDNWYVAGWCESANAYRTFSLDRIERADATEQHVMPVDDTALDRHLGAAFGIFSGEAVDWAVLRFSPEAARWVADEQWHPDQIGHWEGTHYELQVPYSDPQELMMDILKHGPDVEVVAPRSLRKRVADRIREAVEKYG